jgi:predicted kinase
MKVCILRGISGSGKTTLTKRLRWAHDRPGEEPYSAVVVSADTYMVDSNGKYDFDYLRLSECHNKCVRQYLEHLATPVTGKDRLIIVDNTNTTLHEVAPYAQLALAFECELQVITLLCDPVVAVTRSIHDVPIHILFRQDRQLRKSLVNMPPRWNQEVGTEKTLGFVCPTDLLSMLGKPFLFSKKSGNRVTRVTRLWTQRKQHDEMYAMRTVF